MDLPTRFILENRAWADEVNRRDPDFFPSMTDGQQPGIFWIGCADSRVPAELITHAAPGELFVHRSVANMVLHDDISLMSALQYAIQNLKIRDVIVCGHDRCGGVRAAMAPLLPTDGGSSSDGSANGSRNYLAERIRPLRDLYQRHHAEVDSACPDALPDEAGMSRRVDRLVALNVAEQVHSLAATSLVREAWQEGHALRLHGWVYGLENGYLRKILSVDADSLAMAEAA